MNSHSLGYFEYLDFLIKVFTMEIALKFFTNLTSDKYLNFSNFLTISTTFSLQDIF